MQAGLRGGSIGWRGRQRGATLFERLDLKLRAVDSLLRGRHLRRRRRLLCFEARQLIVILLRGLKVETRARQATRDLGQVRGASAFVNHVKFRPDL